MSERDLIEYIIVPPFTGRVAILEAKERLVEYLERRFPGSTFKVTGFAPVGDQNEFNVVPIMNYVGDNGRSYMCDPPKRWFMAVIAESCQLFKSTAGQQA